jgi:RNA polymerase sigma-70 factor, ECF subfamily
MGEDQQKYGVVPDEDSLLVARFKEGVQAESAFDALVIKYKDRVYNLCYRFVGNYEDADDCAQEVFVRVYRFLKDFRGESVFATWLYRITVNVCKNKRLSQEYRNRRNTLSLDVPLETDEGEVKIEVKDESLSPAVAFETKEKRALIQEAIAALPEDQREIVVLRDIEGLSYEEIARVTGMNVGTVKSKLSRARDALSVKLRRFL